MYLTYVIKVEKLKDPSFLYWQCFVILHFAFLIYTSLQVFIYLVL